MRRLIFLLAMRGTWLCAQDAPAVDPPLEYMGSPLQIPYACHDEDLDWAGLACLENSCPIYVELTSAAGSGKTILIGGNFHSSSATLYSLLLRSEDAGRTWREPFARARGVVFDRIQLYDAENGWVSGQTVQPLDLDPFFLITVNGGASWQRVALFEEGTPGAILQFVFDSKDHGLALVDRGGGELRYEVYESQSGGRSWTIQQKSDKPPKLKPAADADWRVRPEPKLFRLEHLEDGRWGPFAAFAIGAAQCREQPRAEPKEPELKP